MSLCTEPNSTKHFPRDDSTGDSGDIEESEPDTDKRENRSRGSKSSNLRSEQQPSFMRHKEIFGSNSPIHLCRDAVSQMSESRRNDMNAMAESIADAIGKDDKVGKLSSRGSG